MLVWTGCRRLVETVSRGAALEPADRDTLVPVLASFATALLAVLATLHDSEIVTSTQGVYYHPNNHTILHYLLGFLLSVSLVRHYFALFH